MSVILAGTAKYTGDSGSDIDNVTAGGFVAIVAPTTASLTGNQCLIIKGSGGANPSLQIDSSAFLTLAVSRATTNLLASAPLSSFPGLSVGGWMMVAGRYNVAGSAGAQQIWAARLGQALREPSPYNTQQVGTGTQVDDSAASIFVGNASGGARPTTCPLFAAAMFNTYPTFNELTRALKELLQTGRRPVLSSVVTRAYRFDRGIGTLVCLKTQNALTPSGTIVLGADPPRPLAGALRFAPGVAEAFPAPVTASPGTGAPITDRRRRAMIAMPFGAPVGGIEITWPSRS